MLRLQAGACCRASGVFRAGLSSCRGLRPLSESGSDGHIPAWESPTLSSVFPLWILPSIDLYLSKAFHLS